MSVPEPVGESPGEEATEPAEDARHAAGQARAPSGSDSGAAAPGDSVAGDGAGEIEAENESDEDAGADASAEPIVRNGENGQGPASGVAPPASDLAPTMDAASLPGAHRGGFSRELTGPVGVTIQSAPIEPGTEDALDYTPAEWAQPSPRVRFAAWALGFAIVGLLVSFLVGWGFLLGIVGIIAGVVSLRRDEARAMAIWAIVLAAVSILYSAGWLVFAATQGAFAGS
ncbi:hypothetical protein [Microbacterium candidum]|uniref:DUF4190 domain-containing protein n=1 Tax=Microbacterium candidum TaxID=3041922 RepID=A0ABT7MXC5_9MICO|nr:hypothetical protein [Microbacterium sp. ASV49]MDL9979081.1 hypothetical protein [Microbacterium sp. ASV49]